MELIENVRGRSNRFLQLSISNIIIIIIIIIIVIIIYVRKYHISYVKSKLQTFYVYAILFLLCIFSLAPMKKFYGSTTV